MDVGQITARLGAHFDDSGFDRYDRAIAQAKRHTDVTTQLKGDYDGRGFQQYERAVRSTDRAHSDFVRGSGRVRTSMGSLFIGGAGVAGATAAFYGLTKGVTSSFSAFKESQAIGRQTAAVLKSTGGEAGITAKQIESLATSISNKTGIDDEAIQSGENLLLTFTNIRNEAGKGNDVFNQSTKVLADMSAALGQDTKSSAIQLGKALNDPIKGVSALQRVGVSFTESQKDQIKTLVDSGKTMDAQKIILRELNKEFGGSAEAQATSSKKLGVTLGNLQETIGAKLSPVIEKASGKLNTFVLGLLDGSAQGGRFAGQVRGAFTTVKNVVGSALHFVGQLLDDNRDSLRKLGAAFSGLVGPIRSSINKVVTAFSRAFSSDGSMGEDIRSIIKQLVALETFVMTKFYIPIVKRILPGIVQAFQGMARIIRGVVQVIAGILTLNFRKAWEGVKNIFSGELKLIGGIMRASTAPLRAAAAAIGGAIGKAFSAAWSGITKAAGGFVNGIIDILNKIPGVNIGHVSWGQSSGRGAGGTSAPAAKPGTGRFAQGGKVTTPIAIMGEEAPQHPEWVIPTNPAYRKRAVALWMSAAREIGIPGFFGGGVLKSAGGALKKAGGAVLDVVGAPVRALLGLLPSIPGGLAGDVLGGAFKYAKDKAIDFIKSHVGLGGGGGDSGVDGLVPRVLAALAYARTRGWGGSVTSGFRSYAQQAALYARYLAGGTLAAAPGTSNHEGGQAVDVTDTEGFAQAMAGAPGSVRLYRRVPGEPWHFSVTGFAKGGKFGKSKHLSSLASRGVMSGQGGLGKYEGAISDMERRYGLHDREFGLSQEEYVVEDEAGAHIDQRAVGHRLGELQDLVQLRQGIRAKILAYRKAVRAAIAAYQLGIRRLRRAIAAIPKGGKKAKRSRATASKLRQGYKDRISEYSGRLKDLGETESSLGFDAEDSRLDLVELQNEMSALSPDALKKLLPTPDTDGPAGDTGSGGDTGGPSDGAPTAADIAAAAAQQLASFNASRAELFAGFGANFNKAGTTLFGSDTQRAAGARFFGAVPADDAGVLEGSGGSTVTVTNHYAAPPEDPHTWSRGLEWELRQG